MRVYAASHFRPKPNLPGFKWYHTSDWDDSEEECLYVSVTWEVVEQEICCGNGLCSAASCRENPDVPVGVLSAMDWQTIAIHLNTLKGHGHGNHSPDSEDQTTDTSLGLPEPILRCSKPERQILHDGLVSWRDTEWARIKPRFPFFSHGWVMTDENIGRLVDKAHVILNTSTIDARFISSIATTTLEDSDPIITSLIELLEDFRENRRSNDAQAALERQTKRTCPVLSAEPDDPFHVHAAQPQDSMALADSSLTNSWQIHGYFHERYVSVSIQFPPSSQLISAFVKGHSFSKSQCMAESAIILPLGSANAASPEYSKPSPSSTSVPSTDSIR